VHEQGTELLHAAAPHGTAPSLPPPCSHASCLSPLPFPLSSLSGELPHAGNQALKSNNGRPPWKASTKLGFLRGTTKMDVHYLPLAILVLNFIRNEL
jgi:hypothetical protein